MRIQPQGKIVYGGGGIIPDVFVPIDNSLHNETLSYIQRRGVIGNFVFEELEKDRHLYDDISRQEFIDNFKVDENLVFDFQDYLNVRTGSKITFFVVGFLAAVVFFVEAFFTLDLRAGMLFPRKIKCDEMIILRRKLLSIILYKNGM